METMNWIPNAVNGGALAIVATFVYYLLTKTIPDINAAHAVLTKQNAETVATLVQKFSEELTAQRNNHSQYDERRVVAFITELAAQRVGLLLELSESRKVIERNTDSIKLLTVIVTKQDQDMRLAHEKELVEAVARLKMGKT